MSGLVVDRTSLARTEAIPAHPDWIHLPGTGEPFGAISDQKVLVTLISGIYRTISEGTLAARMMLENRLLLGTGQATSSRPPLIVRSLQERPTEVTPSDPQTVAQAAIAEIRAVSGLTNEEIAPLAGVSRRSLQAWIAGEPISARKEQRLRGLRDAVRGLAGADSQITRARLLDRVPGNVRAYDLLAEGRFEQAIDLALDRRSNTPAPPALQAHDLYAQLNHIESRVELAPERVSRRFSGRLRR
jgi:DNA-binding transcriptional regulator YiaG